MPNQNLLLNSDKLLNKSSNIKMNQEKYYHHHNNNTTNLNRPESSSDAMMASLNTCSPVLLSHKTANSANNKTTSGTSDHNNANDSSFISVNSYLNFLNKSNNANTHCNGFAKPLKVLICTESFHPYTSGIARRFKEIIERLSKRGFLIHIVTGCKGSETWTRDADLKDKVTFSILKAIEFKDKIDCALPFLLPQVGLIF
jgi:hypothetical protein